MRGRCFTLVEAVGAMVILAVAVPPMLWAISGSVRRAVDPLLASRARWLAAERLEDVIADRHAAGRGYAYLIAQNYPAETAVAGWERFARAVAFADTGHDLVSAGSGYRRVTVTVSWSDAGGTARSMSLATVLTDYAGP